MDILSIVNNSIIFLSNHQILIYLILFVASFSKKIASVPLFIYSIVFFLTGSILAGMGVLNIWAVIAILYLGGLLGDSTNYFLGRKYGINLYKYFENKKIFKICFNKTNYTRGLNFFKMYDGYSIFFARFLSSTTCITPFIAGVNKLNYKTFLLYDFPAIILSIGQFIIVGYFIGVYYKIILILFIKYLFVLLFIGLIFLYLYIYLKRKKYLSQFKDRWISSKKKLFIVTIKHFASITIITMIIFFFFLLYLSFGYSGSVVFTKTNKTISKTILLNNAYLNNCKNLNTYYSDSRSNIIQPINIIIVTNKDISTILNKDWTKVPIFRKRIYSLSDFVKSLRNKKLPVSNLYMNYLSQTDAYQYKESTIIDREHIRFWDFANKDNTNQKIYLGSISNDDGITFQFYNYFFTPIHKINRNVDNSRDFLRNYLVNQKNISCKYIQTSCRVKKAKNSDEQQYYTDGKILLCNTTNI